jgi:hypothetical protein
MARLAFVDENKVRIQKDPVKWDGLLMKLVAQVGLMTPINGAACFAERPDHTPDGLDLDQEATHEPQPEDGESDDESDVDNDEVNPASASQDDVRRLARVRVYNMAYSHPSRAYGPFLPPNTTRPRSPSNAVPPVPPIPHTNLDLDSTDLDGGGDNERETGGEGLGDVVANGQRSSSTAGLSGTRSVHTPGVVQGDQLPRFDWAWIAAAHQLIEFNMRDLLRRERHQAVLRAFLSLEGLRSCSAPGFPPEAVADKDKDGGEGGRTFGDGEGWDWAGVEGQWRCVVSTSSHNLSVLKIKSRPHR